MEVPDDHIGNVCLEREKFQTEFTQIIVYVQLERIFTGIADENLIF